ncbi:hypothetical protein ATKI12_0852 [Kitasatospora sp. Ki12]
MGGTCGRHGVAVVYAKWRTSDPAIPPCRARRRVCQNAVPGDPRTLEPDRRVLTGPGCPGTEVLT